MTSNVGSTTSTKSGSNIIEFTFGKEDHEHTILALQTVVMNESKGYFQDTSDDQIIKELSKEKTFLMKGPQYLNIVRLYRIPIFATIEWIWTNNLTKHTPQNSKISLSIDAILSIQ